MKSNTGRQVMHIQGQSPNDKYYFIIRVKNSELKIYLDLGSTCNLIKESACFKIGLTHNGKGRKVSGFGGGMVKTLGITEEVLVELDKASAVTQFLVVPDETLFVEGLIGQPFTEQEHIKILKDVNTVRVCNKFLDVLPQEVELPPTKIPLWVAETTVLPPKHSLNLLMPSRALSLLPLYHPPKSKISMPSSR